MYIYIITIVSYTYTLYVHIYNYIEYIYIYYNVRHLRSLFCFARAQLKQPDTNLCWHILGWGPAHVAGIRQALHKLQFLCKATRPADTERIRDDAQSKCCQTMQGEKILHNFTMDSDWTVPNDEQNQCYWIYRSDHVSIPQFACLNLAESPIFLLAESS